MKNFRRILEAGRIGRTTQEIRALQATVWNLRRLLREAMSGGAADDVIAALRWMVDNSERLEKAFVAWVDLVEILVQNAEERYGTAPGRGRLKADEVKEVLKYLLRAQRFNLPNVPDYLEPVIIDIAAELKINLVVQIVNDNGLWVASNRKARPDRFSIWTLLRWVKSILRGIARFTRPLWEWFPRLLVRIYFALRRRMALTPEVRAAVERVERDGLVGDLREVFTLVTRVVIWVGEHGPQVVAAFRVIVAVTQEAERFTSLSGPEKKRYALELVWALLSDLGLDIEDGLLRNVLNTTAAIGIEIAVHLFHKRGVFKGPSPAGD